MIEKPENSAAAIRARFEVLPLGRSEEEAAPLPEPVRLTVTCSPKHGPDRSVLVTGRLACPRPCGRGASGILMVRDRAHLDALLAGMAEAQVDDVFVIGGDASPPHGCYASAVELVPIMLEHPQRPRTIGIAGYPEGHPLIDPETLDQALAEKSQLADYVTTQLCFDPQALLAWIAGRRERGMTLPVLIGVPGKVARRRLLEMSVRVGAFTSTPSINSSTRGGGSNRKTTWAPGARTRRTRARPEVLSIPRRARHE